MLVTGYIFIFFALRPNPVCSEATSWACVHAHDNRRLCTDGRFKSIISIFMDIFVNSSNFVKIKPSIWFLFLFLIGHRLAEYYNLTIAKSNKNFLQFLLRLKRHHAITRYIMMYSKRWLWWLSPTAFTNQLFSLIFTFWISSSIRFQESSITVRSGKKRYR